MLTPKQCELLLFIHRRIRETGVSPSFEEMKEALALKSKSGIHRLIVALEERGFIRRMPHRARALEVLKVPDALAAEHAGAHGDSSNTKHTSSTSSTSNTRQQTYKRGLAPAFRPNVIEGDRRARQRPGARARLSGQRDLGTVSVPVMGRIAAGVPISAIQDHSRDLEVPPDMVAQGEHFALEVKGDSMIEAGIHDGDLVIIRKTSTANNGDIVVALVDNEEATLKRLRKRGNSVALEAANPAYETRIFGPDRVDIQGRLVGLIRRY